MTENDEEGRLELHGDGEDIMRFLAELKKRHSNITKLSGSYTSNASTGEGGIEVSFTCRTEEGDIEAVYHEKTPSCASIEEAEEMNDLQEDDDQGASGSLRRGKARGHS